MSGREPSSAEDMTGIRYWLEQFSSAVRAKDYDGGRDLFADEVVGFGTYAGKLAGLETLVEEQWRNIWGVTRGFRFDLEDMRCGAFGDLAWVAVTWYSQGQSSEGAWYDRSGRATFALERRGGR